MEQANNVGGGGPLSGNGIHSTGTAVVVEYYGAAYDDCAARSRIVYQPTPPA